MPLQGLRATAQRIGICVLLLIGQPLIEIKALAGKPTWALPAPQATNFTLEGKITQHSPGKLTVNTGENIVFHVRYDEKTEIKRPDGSAGSAKDFRVGAKVKVEGDLTESGEVVAQKIEIQREADAERHETAPRAGRSPGRRLRTYRVVGCSFKPQSYS